MKHLILLASGCLALHCARKEETLSWWRQMHSGMASCLFGIGDSYRWLAKWIVWRFFRPWMIRITGCSPRCLVSFVGGWIGIENASSTKFCREGNAAADCLAKFGSRLPALGVQVLETLFPKLETPCLEIPCQFRNFLCCLFIFQCIKKI